MQAAGLFEAQARVTHAFIVERCCDGNRIRRRQHGLKVYNGHDKGLDSSAAVIPST